MSRTKKNEKLLEKVKEITNNHENILSIEDAQKLGLISIAFS